MKATFAVLFAVVAISMTHAAPGGWGGLGWGVGNGWNDHGHGVAVVGPDAGHAVVAGPSGVIKSHQGAAGAVVVAGVPAWGWNGVHGVHGVQNVHGVHSVVVHGHGHGHNGWW